MRGGGGGGGGSTLSSQFSSSTSTTYLMHTYSVVNGDVLMWWGTCDRTALNSGIAITLAYRTSNDDVTATTSVYASGSGANTAHRSGFARFVATTTYDVYVESTGNVCTSFELMSRKTH